MWNPAHDRYKMTMASSQLRRVLLARASAIPASTLYAHTLRIGIPATIASLPVLYRVAVFIDLLRVGTRFQINLFQFKPSRAPSAAKLTRTYRLLHHLAESSAVLRQGLWGCVAAQDGVAQDGALEFGGLVVPRLGASIFKAACCLVYRVMIPKVSQGGLFVCTHTRIWLQTSLPVWLSPLTFI